MATLVLTAVGTALGGPIGGLLGSVAGQAIDSRWLTPGGGRRGPRLSDLRVQTSSYGTAIPRLYGRMRVAGTVIWATDLVEHRDRRSAGKGQPKVTSYSYTASFAVALSSRQIASVGRIWAEGNILRRSDGSFAERTGFRLHRGGEDQAADPLIVAAEGVDHAPAYRGMAYVVFEDLDLSPFGNRIPSLSFEVVADDGALTLVDPLADMLGTALGGAEAAAITGYAASGASVGDAAGALVALLPIARSPGGDWAVAGAGTATALPAASSVNGTMRIERQLGAADRLPQSISHGHFDPARDFQSSVQTAILPGARGSATALDLPLAQTAGAARALVEREAAEVRAARIRTNWPGGLAGLALPPGMVVLADGVAMRVTARRIEGGAATLDLTRAISAAVPVLAADSGRALTAPDEPAGDTVAALFDLPALNAADGDAPKLMLAAAGTGPGWRRAAVTVTASANALPIDGGEVRAAAILGHVTGWQGAGTAVLLDRQGWIDVELVRTDMALSNADPSDLLAGANAAMIGNEVIQFGLATPTGPRHWRLSHLLRGRQGTEDAMAHLAAGAPFVRLSDAALLPITAPGIAAGGSLFVEAIGGNAVVDLPILVAGRALRPLSPVHLRSAWQADGGLALSWIRRSRTGFGWVDGVDAPQDALPESYHLTIDVGGVPESITLSAAEHMIAAVQITAWKAAGTATLSVSVQQIGPHALSLPILMSVSL